MTRSRTALVVGVGALAALALGAVVADAQPPGPGAPSPVLDGIRNVYQGAAPAYRAKLTPIAQRTFGLLAAIEFAVSGIVYMLRRDSLDEIAGKFLLKFTVTAVLLSLLTAFTVWVPPIFAGWVAAGEHAIGGGAANPSDIVDIGQALAMGVLHSLSMTVALKDPAMAVFAAIAALVLCGAYIIVAAQLTLVLVEVAVVISAGGIAFLGFLGSRWTAGIAEGLLAYAFALGIRAFLLLLIVGLGADLARSWVPLIATADLAGPASPLFQVLFGSVTFALVSIRIPNVAAARLTAQQSFGIANALRALS
jgi:type IV secretion system protein TrbL